MKFYDTQFDDYVNSCDKNPLHPNLLNVYNAFPDNLKDLKNIIFYGPCGVGKYTQSLRAIRKYSPSKLKYEKKITDIQGKTTQIIKISDIHFEVDMSLLGCNSKSIWNDIYTRIVDVISTYKHRTGIIICKNFHNIHRELIDIFYSYMQTYTITIVDIKFIFLTENISFLPDNIVNRCKIIRVSRPSRIKYNNCLSTKINRSVKTTDITNIKNITTTVKELMNSHTLICHEIIEAILDLEKFRFIEIRERLYDIFIYDLDVGKCIWYILGKIIDVVPHEDFGDIVERTLVLCKLYNNNYRPIYHLESFVIYLVNKVHGFGKN